jgi:hypothetical protein
MWDEADLELVRELAYLHHAMERGGYPVAVAREVRQRCDDLGLSTKGKQERRWRVTSDEVAERRVEAAADPYAHLKAVPDAVAGS